MSVLQAAAADQEIIWRQWKDIPNADGLKGMYAGTSRGHVILAGGSNFPGGRSAGRIKQFHDEIFVCDLTVEGRPWRMTGGKLPMASGEGAAVSTSFGIVGVGGRNAQGSLREVFLLSWNRESSDVERTALPDLPEAVATPAIAVIDDMLYVAGGEGAKGAVAGFWRLDVARALKDPARSVWEALPVWMNDDVAGNSGLYGAMLVAVKENGRSRLLLAGGLAGSPRSQADYLRNVYCFDPATRLWAKRSPMPRGAVLGAGLTIKDGTHVVVLGGSDGHDFARLKELGERYRIPADVLWYDVARDTWSQRQSMPLGLVGASVIELGKSWLVAGGEYSPGLRTAQVYEMEILAP
ncbi:hypothetical protein [Oleiharenicola lentus]|uniref:hypothetical protein n=1 Tax=Oleiharenicola lentus TaxID=2508720 RepID=UPI003F66582A